VAAATYLAEQQAEIPRRRRRRRIIGAVCVAAAAAVGFLAVAVLWPNPNQQLLRDMPVLEDLDELRHVFSPKEENVEFLRLLRHKGLFVKDASDES